MCCPSSRGLQRQTLQQIERQVLSVVEQQGQPRPARLACNTRAKRSAWLSRLSRRWMTRVSSASPDARGAPARPLKAVPQCGDRPFRVSQTGSVNDSASASRPLPPAPLPTADGSLQAAESAPALWAPDRAPFEQPQQIVALAARLGQGCQHVETRVAADAWPCRSGSDRGRRAA